MSRIDTTMTEWVSVKNVSSKGAVCFTSYGSQISVDWRSGRPDPLPMAGETWLVERYFVNSWRFLSKMDASSFNQMRFWLLVDAEDCYGSEKSVADDVVKGKFDGVYLRVAGNGVVMWESSVAADLGLSCPGDSVTEMVSRLDKNGVPVTFVVDCDLWPDTSSATQEAYQQVVVASDGTRKRSKRMSPAGAASAMASLVSELYAKYGTIARGICFNGFGIDGVGADMSAASVNGYVAENLMEVDAGVVAYDGTADWWKRRSAWDEWLAESEKKFLTTVSTDIGTWPVGAVVSDRMLCLDDGAHMLGRMACGIPDEFGRQGWSRVGMPMSIPMQADVSAEMREMELLSAYLGRLADTAVALPVLSLRSFSDFRPVFEVLSRYGMGDVVLGDYDSWRRMPDEAVLDLSSAMGSYRVSPLPSENGIGIMVSSDTRDCTRLSVTESVSYVRALYELVSEVIDGTPQPVKVLFDSDVDEEVPSGLDAVCLFDVRCLGDRALATVKRMLDATGTVIVGECGTRVGRSEETRTSPMDEAFGIVTYGTGEFEGGISVPKGKIESHQTVYLLTSRVSGSSVKAGGMAESEDGEVPLAFHGKSSWLGMSADDDKVTKFLVSRMVRRAIGSE